jgi:hypothetical protein
MRNDENLKIRDNEHLKLLSVFHFVVGCMALFGIAFLALHYLIMREVFTHPERWQTKGTPPPPGFFAVFIWLYIFIGAIFITASILNILSGIFILQRRYRMFSLVIAGLDCFQVPIGTALGVFTIIVLLRDSVRQSYVD